MRLRVQRWRRICGTPSSGSLRGCSTTMPRQRAARRPEMDPYRASAPPDGTFPPSRNSSRWPRAPSVPPIFSTTPDSGMNTVFPAVKNPKAICSAAISPKRGGFSAFSTRPIRPRLLRICLSKTIFRSAA